jgi:MFS transporter, ACS family, hexuronate transporter
VTDAISPSLGSSRSFNGFRWVILALIFFGTTFNYIDRIVISILKDDLQKTYSISEPQWGYIAGAFAIVYAFGQILSGRLLDLIGTRAGYGLAMIAWSLCAMATALGCGPVSFSIFRGCLGFSESPSFPAAAKVCAEWFPRRQRAFAFGFVNAGANMAAIITPLVVPWLALRFGWQAAFVWTGSMGLVLAAVWITLFRRPEAHPWVSPKELALIKSDPPEAPVKLPWREMVKYRQTWVFAVGKLFTDSIWWFFLTWIPGILAKPPYNLDLKNIGLPLVMIYLMADLGSVGGGLLSSLMIRRGASVNVARKMTMLICGTMALPIMFVPMNHNVWVVVLLIGLATAGHQGFSSNLYTLCSDMFPTRLVASIAGFGGFFGYVSASLFQPFTGYWVQYMGDNHPEYPALKWAGPFFCAAVAYLTALGFMHLLSRDFKPAVIPVEPAVPLVESA